MTPRRHPTFALRGVYVLLVALGWVLFAMTIAWPSAALVVRCLFDGAAPDGGFRFSERQLGLLLRTAWLSAIATLLCHIVALPAVLVISRHARGTDRRWVAAACVACLTCTPMIYAFGWGKLLPSGFQGYAGCVWTWALWAWPVPALILGAGLSRSASAPLEAAALETSSVRALWHVGLPALWGFLAVSALIVFAFFFHEYAVPHAYSLQVFATDLLGWASSSPRPIDTLWRGLLPLGVIVPLLTLILATGRRLDREAESVALVVSRRCWRLGLAGLLGVFVLSWLIPVGALVLRLSSMRALYDTAYVYGVDIVATLATALFAGVAVMLMGFGVSVRRAATVPLIWAVTLGLLPGALIGQAVIAAYNFPAAAPVFDHWPAIVVGYIARFGWMGILTALVANRYVRRSTLEQARIDGAAEGDILLTVRWPIARPLLFGTVAVVAALSVGEVATTSLLRVPDYSPITLVIIEKFHRFEDDMLTSLSSLVVATSLVAGLAVAWAAGRASRLRIFRAQP